MDITKGQKKNTAGTKAKADIADILLKTGFTRVKFNIKSNRLMKFVWSKHDLKDSLKRVDRGDTLVIQYPMYSRYALKILLTMAKTKGFKTVGIIHDVETLRLYKGDKRRIKDELNALNQFDVLVVHNSKMKTWLKENGIVKRMFSIEIFDYLADTSLVSTGIDKDIVFAGNLEKSLFLKEWNLKRKVNLYGINPQQYGGMVSYKGVKTPEELPNFLNGSFGLVWDGNTLRTNSGIYGEYTKYNNPHKTSLYISSGLPVVVWKQSAVAEFVRENHVGLVVDDLNKLDIILKNLNNTDYENLVKNSRIISAKMRKGFYTKTVLKKCIDYLDS